jgi:hypothetical protein
MTWLSRLLPQSRSLQRRADHRHDRRGRQGRRHRRTVNLEWLEPRTLLAGNVTVGPVVNGVLTIAADTHSDSFQIAEIGGNQVVVSGTPIPGTHTSINGLPPGTSVFRNEVLSIVVTVPGDGQNSPNISVVQSGATSGIGGITFLVGSQAAPPQPAGPDLTLTVTGVVNTGALTVLDIPGGTLNAAVTGSVFSSIDIEQQNCCPATVSLTNDLASGVAVNLGWAQGDSITFHNDNFGSTSFTLGNGPDPQMANCDNAGSTISGDDSNFRDLTITEPLSGADQSISVGTASGGVELSVIGFGISATQGDGASNTISIASITTPGGPIDDLHAGPPSIVSVQGDGDNDQVVVESSTVVGNIESYQGDGNGDYAATLGSQAGFAFSFGPYVFDFFGNATVSQGNGCNDVADLDGGDVLNNIYVSQGDSIAFPGFTSSLGDEVHINDSTLTSDIIIQQGSSQAIGNAIVTIGDSSPVTAGGAATITQNGANNTVVLGAAGSSFATEFLDINTGAGGGGFVTAANTTVLDGSYFGYDFVIDGGGGGNVFLDEGGNSGVFISQNYT